MSQRQFSRLLESEDGERTDKCQVDLVLVLPRPPNDDTIQKFTSKEVDDIFDEILTARDRHAEIGAAETGIDDSYPCCTALESKLKEGNTVTLLELQDAVVEDMVNFLSDQGCWMEAFMSIDRDELFLLVSLGDPSKTAQECVTALSAAQEWGLRLQTTFDGRTLPTIGIKQTVRPHAEAYLPYSQAVTETSVRRFKFAAPASTGRALFKRYSAGIGGAHGTILRTVDRVRVLMWVLGHFIDVEDAKGCPILLDYYVPHSMQKLEGFRSGYENPEDAWDNAHAAWANFNISTIAAGLPLKTMFSSCDVAEAVRAAQPIDEIRNYFGEQIAFYFVWLSYTTQVLLFALVPAALLSVLLVAFQPHHDFANFAGEASDAQKTKAGWEAIFSLSAVTVYCIGGMLYVKGWLRLQNYYRQLWDPMASTVAYGHRPDYFGDMVPNPVNENKNTKLYPPCKAACRRIMSTTAMVIFIVATIAVVLVVFHTEKVLVDDYEVSPDIAQTIVSSLFTVQITIFQLVWDATSAWLVESTNPRTDDDAGELSVRFLFPFSFISTYANIGFHAFYSSWGDECMTENCIITLRPALISVVCPAMALQVVSMLIPYAKYRYSLFAEVQDVVKKGEPAPERAFVESQAKRPSFGVHELNKEMNIMIILVGYVLLFGFAAPSITFFVFLAFLVKIRVDAFKLCSVYQRVTPQQHYTGRGIGEWNEVLKSMVKIAQWTCITVPLFNLEYFKLPIRDIWVARLIHIRYDDEQLHPLQKIMLAFVLKEIVNGIASAIDCTISEHSSTELLMSAKRSQVIAQFTTKLSARHHKVQEKIGADTAQAAVAPTSRPARLIGEVRAKSVPRLFERPGAREKFDWREFGVATDRATWLGV